MNAFANTLFALLLSWVKGLVQTVWNMFSGGADGFFVWLGDHWLGLVAVICLLGAAADLIVWLFRWRPDLVWRTKMRRFRAWLSGREMREREEKHFYQGYEEAVDMQQMMGYDVNAAWQDDGSQTENVQEEPIWWDVPETGIAYQTDAASVHAQPRRRRSDKYQKTGRQKKLSQIKDKWQEDETAMLDELPTAVDSKEAFYDPVFPVQEKKQR